jgi:hypothetical protein
MGVNASFYFNNRVTPNEIASAIKQELNIDVDLSNIRFEKSRFDSDSDRHFGYIKVGNSMFYFYAYNHISGGERDNTNNDTISGGIDDDSVDVLKVLGKYFGGYLCSYDNDEKYEYIEPTSSLIPLTEKQYLENIVREQISYKYVDKVLEFLKINKDYLKKNL